MQLTEVRPFYGGSWHDAPIEEVVPDKFTNEPATRLGCSDEGQVREAVTAAIRGQQSAGWGPADRFRVLTRASALLLEQAADVVATIVADSGFTVSDAAREVERAAQTLQISGEEAKRLVGEVIPLEGAPGVRGRIGYTVFHPVGVVAAITPFNSPLNTLLHKVAPALAAGNSVVLKPASQTPRTADRILRLLLEAGVPAGLLSFVYGSGAVAGQALLDDPRPAFYAFTGSTEVGLHVRRSVGLRRTQLEMGSLSSTIVCADADTDTAAAKIVAAAFRKAGQVCTSVQRLYVERSAVPDMTAKLADIVSGKKAGDPALPDTFVGPVISPAEADRISQWIEEATDGGASLMTGGSRDGNVVTPTVLGDVRGEMAVMSREIFGPVVVVRPFDDLDSAISEVNDTPYGLAAGIFTRDINRALVAADRLHMGSVHINETSSSRVDLMPYTGAKSSGVGREGPRYAMREMSEERLVTIGPG
ncbi:MAG: aldehyde dehydrogenase family protein [Streptosporangiaceae bacterium]|jgi:acyl-CoA reductase-like NAD-dependent aldehyde dehydrogenase